MFLQAKIFLAYGFQRKVKKFRKLTTECVRDALRIIVGSIKVAM